MALAEAVFPQPLPVLAAPVAPAYVALREGARGHPAPPLNWSRKVDRTGPVSGDQFDGGRPLALTPRP